MILELKQKQQIQHFGALEYTSQKKTRCSVQSSIKRQDLPDV